MEVLDEHIARRRQIHELYKCGLSDIEGIAVLDNPTPDFKSIFWLTTITIDSSLGKTPDDVRVALEKENIETRLLWRPMHMQPIYKDAPYYGTSIAEELFNTGLCLPSGSSLTDDNINRVITALHKALS